ncbi:hypothetical protein [Streptomyces roseoverticillatus]|uniref:hypothetical protein n=1 Tax=Streptomyces roseoverticillatus TaxID=66429 RepID=UPI0004BF8ED5|nr:hypothetical protein [Streptomyces roseoverticillatus]
MTLRTPESRRRRATTLVTQVAEIIHKQGRRSSAPYYLILLDIRDVLADPESDAETALADAAYGFKLLYGAPRGGFSEFYIHHDDPKQMAAENQRFSELVSELSSMIHDS